MEKIFLLLRTKAGLMNQAPTGTPKKGGLDKSNPYKVGGLDKSKPFSKGMIHLV
jgi:hypothetical protein